MTRGLALSLLLFFWGGAALGWLATGSFSDSAGPSARIEASLSEPGGPTSSAGEALPGDRPAEAATADNSVAAFPATSAGYRGWARRDPLAFLTALPEIVERGDEALVFLDVFGDSMDSPIGRSSGGSRNATAARLAVEADPWLALEIAGSMSSSFGAMLRAAALEAIASLDPEAALALIGKDEPRNVRYRLLAAVAAGYARYDLDAAVEWVSALDNLEKTVAVLPVVIALASVDLVRALDLDEQSFGRLNSGREIEWLRSGLESGSEDPSRVADRLAGTQSTSLLAGTMEWWVHRDTFGAIGWVLLQETVSATAIERMAATLTEKDSQSAVALAAQFPPAVRARWIETIVGTLAGQDPNAAMDVLSRFAGESFYSEAQSRLAAAMAVAGGAEQAALLVGNTPQTGTALTIVDSWPNAQRAAEWALAIEDPQTRDLALVSSIANWVRTDVPAARSWISGIPDEDLRTIMTGVLCAEDPECSAP